MNPARGARRPPRRVTARSPHGATARHPARARGSAHPARGATHRAAPSPRAAAAGYGSAIGWGAQLPTSGGGQLEHDSRAALAGRRGESSAVGGGDRAGDREPVAAGPNAATPPSSAWLAGGTSPTYKLGDRGVQSGPAIEHLDPDPRRLDATSDLYLPSPVLDRVRNQIGRRLGES